MLHFTNASLLTSHESKAFFFMSSMLITWVWTHADTAAGKHL